MAPLPVYDTSRRDEQSARFILSPTALTVCCESDYSGN
jgi:hypothetical protein